jgi:putative two-component system response regulator
MEPLSEKTVLVVDDESTITDLIINALGSQGFDCRAASNGPEALEMLSERTAAFVLTDVRMPAMSGLDLLEQVRAHYPHTFVILLTGAADVSIVVRALRSGACDFLTKPFSLVELIQRMGVALEKREVYLADLVEHEIQERKLEYISSQYKDLTEGVYASLKAALCTKHPETCAHSERVALRAVQLANALGMSKPDIQALYVAGLLHDIGKVAVDSSVLDKAGALEKEEFDQIKSHPIQSAEILAHVALSPVTLDAVRHHHERYDGTGYPDRLAGEIIPFSARVLAVCDAYDAMTSERTYQPALPPEEGFSRLRAGAGTQWDPLIVDKFCELERQTSKN